jgi:hypothetical protein
MAHVQVLIRVEVDGDVKEFTSTTETDGNGYRAATAATQALEFAVADWANALRHDRQRPAREPVNTTSPQSSAFDVVA